MIAALMKRKRGSSPTRADLVSTARPAFQTAAHRPLLEDEDTHHVTALAHVPEIALTP